MDSIKSRLDDIDFTILADLQQGSSRPMHELAEQIGLSTAACARRVKRLEELGVIEKYVAILNPEIMELDLDVFVSVRLKSQGHKYMTEFCQLVSRMPEVVECYIQTGESDFLLHVKARGVKEYGDWMKDTLRIYNGIFSIQSSIALERIKYSTAIPIFKRPIKPRETRG